MSALVAFIAQATTSPETGLIGGGVVGGSALITALVMMFRYKEAAQREVIDVHKLRGDDAEKRHAEEAETRAQQHVAEMETRRLFAAALQAIAESSKAQAQSNAAIGDGLKVLSGAVTRAANRGAQ